MRQILSVIFLAWLLGPAAAGEVTVAVASSFQTTLEALKPGFEAQGHKLTIVAGATGKLATQIKQGAPFDVLLSADDSTTKGLGIDSSEFTYALGKLVLYGKPPGLGADWLKAGNYSHIAIANPRLAPYGRAADEVLTGLAVEIADKRVTAENVGQAFTMAETGNADAAFVALGQTRGKAGTVWVIPPELYAPIRQNAILTNHGKDNADAIAFLDYLKSSDTGKLIEDAGFGR